MTVLIASFCLRFPRCPAIRTFIPTPIQIDTAFINVVIGKDRETAVNAFLLNRATKALSNKLYEYRRNMENSGGNDISKISFQLA